MWIEKEPQLCMSTAKRIHVDDGVGNTYDLVEADGTLFPAYFCEDPVQRITEVKNMPARDDDVVIVAYPKAGTHWLWEITNMLLRGSAEYHPSVKEAQMIEMVGTSGAEGLTSPRVFNSHLRFNQLPKDMIDRNCKLIYVTRNPKDMAVSRFCHNRKGAVGYKGTFSDYLGLYMDGKVAFGSWFDYTVNWNNAIQDNKGYPIHTVVYEELKRDSINEVKKLAQFLGTKADDTLIAAVCEQCDFSNLKNSYEKAKQQTSGVVDDPTLYAFRKGQIGDWKSWFTVAESELFDQHLKEKIPNHKLDYIYQ